jgi:hypothetical protein
MKTTGTACAVLLCALTMARAGAAAEWSYPAGMLGVAPGEVIRLNVANTFVTVDPAEGACQVELNFANATGGVFRAAPATFTLAPGQSAFSDLPFSEAAAISGNTRPMVRPLVTANCFTGGVRPRDLQVTAEVYDGETGRAGATAAFPYLRPTVGDWNGTWRSGALGLAAGQVVRLNAVNTAEAAPGVGACQVELNLADVNGGTVTDPETFTLAPGQSAFADFPYDSAAQTGLAAGDISGNTRVLVRSVIAIRCDTRTLLPAIQLTLEVYDAVSGRTSVLVFINGGKPLRAFGPIRRARAGR